MLLQVVAFATDVGNDFKAICQADLTHLTQSRVRLLRGGGINTCANPAFLRAFLQSRNFALGYLGNARFAHELINGRHINILQRPGTENSMHAGNFVIQSRDTD